MSGRAGGSDANDGADGATDSAIVGGGVTGAGSTVLSGEEPGADSTGLSETGLSETGLSETGLSEMSLSETGLSETSLSETSLSETGRSTDSWPGAGPSDTVSLPSGVSWSATAAPTPISAAAASTPIVQRLVRGPTSTATPPTWPVNVWPPTTLASSSCG